VDAETHSRALVMNEVDAGRDRRRDSAWLAPHRVHADVGLHPGDETRTHQCDDTRARRERERERDTERERDRERERDIKHTHTNVHTGVGVHT
jgi:hypothetical protein